MSENSEGKVGITVRVDAKKREEFNEYARKTGISPGGLIRNFIYATLENQKAA